MCTIKIAVLKCWNNYQLEEKKKTIEKARKMCLFFCPTIHESKTVFLLGYIVWSHSGKVGAMAAWSLACSSADQVVMGLILHLDRTEFSFLNLPWLPYWTRLSWVPRKRYIIHKIKHLMFFSTHEKMTWKLLLCN